VGFPGSVALTTEQEAIFCDEKNPFLFGNLLCDRQSMLDIASIVQLVFISGERREYISKLNVSGK
jgi:hypothetical protein